MKHQLQFHPKLSLGPLVVDHPADIAIHQLLLSRLARGAAMIALTHEDWYAQECAAATAIRSPKSEESNHWLLSSGF
ncbi:MAG: hypothetical protein ACLGSD_14300 [Acidobacteriota bacterium]